MSLFFGRIKQVWIAERVRYDPLNKRLAPPKLVDLELPSEYRECQWLFNKFSRVFWRDHHAYTEPCYVRGGEIPGGSDLKRLAIIELKPLVEFAFVCNCRPAELVYRVWERNSVVAHIADNVASCDRRDDCFLIGHEFPDPISYVILRPPQLCCLIQSGEEMNHRLLIVTDVRVSDA